MMLLEQLAAWNPAKASKARSRLSNNIHPVTHPPVTDDSNRSHLAPPGAMVQSSAETSDYRHGSFLSEP
jgi:hypothetical protein